MKPRRTPCAAAALQPLRVRRLCVPLPQDNIDPDVADPRIQSGPKLPTPAHACASGSLAHGSLRRPALDSYVAQCGSDPSLPPPLALPPRSLCTSPRPLPRFAFGRAQFRSGGGICTLRFPRRIAMAVTRGDVKLWSFLAMFMWLGGFHVNFLVGVLCISHLPSLWAITVLALWITLMFVPAEYNSPLGSIVARFIVKHATNYFPIKVVFEDVNAFDPNQSYVIAAEPHSVLPIGIVVLTPQSGVLPVNKLRALASNAVFWSPLVRHIWTWLGVAPITRKSFSEFLQQGISCIVVPGGVQECLYLEEGREVVFLKQRYGFIKVAMEAGSPLVPTFCFGQSNAYKWWKPSGKWYNQFSRAVGFTPLYFWGRFGGPVPFRNPMYYVVGKPIPVTKNTNPSREEVAVVHGQFVVALEALFENHKRDLGFEGTTLEVY